MPTTTRPATKDDAGVISTLWNAKAGAANSCWSNSDSATAAFIRDKLLPNSKLAIAHDGLGNPQGFLLWHGGFFRAVVAADVETYYRLLIEYCNDVIAQGLTLCESRAPAREPETEEVGWVRTLSPPIVFENVGFSAITGSQTKADRAVMEYRLTSDPSALKAAALAKLRDL